MAGSNQPPCWFVVITRWGQWKMIPKRLKELGVGCYIPPGYHTMVFLRTDKARALSIVNAGEVKGHFIIDHRTHTLLEVPEEQMQAFIRVTTEHPEAVVSPEVPIAKGARVRVVRGSLKGVEGEVVEMPSGTSLVVRILNLLSAKVSIPREDLILV